MPGHGQGRRSFHVWTSLLLALFTSGDRVTQGSGVTGGNVKLSFQWLETRPTRQICPVCKAGISKEKVIPLYGRGSTEGTDPR